MRRGARKVLESHFENRRLSADKWAEDLDINAEFKLRVIGDGVHTPEAQGIAISCDFVLHLAAVLNNRVLGDNGRKRFFSSTTDSGCLTSIPSQSLFWFARRR